MKKRYLSKLSLVFLFLLIIFTTLGCSKMSDEERINLYKKETYKFLDEHQDYFVNPETTLKAEDMIKAYNPTDDECLGIQSQNLSKIDIEKFTLDFKIEDYADKNDFLLELVLFFHLTKKWEATLSKEDIIMTKIMPILKGSDIKLKMRWISYLTESLLSIHNEKLPFKEENRYMVMDFLIEIVSDKSNPVLCRYLTARAWEAGENREEEIYKVFNILLQDEIIFEKMGTLLWFLRKEAPKLYDMMFSILEKREKYSDKIILGSLGFFFRDSVNFRNDIKGSRRKRIKKILNEILKGNENNILKNKSELIKLNIKENEKEGKYK